MTASLSTSTSTGSLPAGVSSLSTGLSTTNSAVANLSTSISTAASSLLSTLSASTFASVSSLSTVVSASATHYYGVNDGGSTLGNYDNRGATGSYAVAVGASAVALGNGATASWDGAITIGHAAVAQNGRAAYTGIPATTALTMIPEVDRGKTLAIGIGTGSYQGYSDAARAFSARITHNLKIKGGVSGGAGGYSYGAAASYQW